MILVDTDIFVDSLRGIPSANDFILRNMEEIRITHFSVLELPAGAKSKAEQNKLLKSFSFSILSVNEEIMTSAISIFMEFGLKQGTGIIDSVIASAAIYYNVPLYTRNLKHYKNISGLEFFKD